MGKSPPRQGKACRSALGIGHPARAGRVTRRALAPRKEEGQQHQRQPTGDQQGRPVRSPRSSSCPRGSPCRIARAALTAVAAQSARVVARTSAVRRLRIRLNQTTRNDRTTRPAATASKAPTVPRYAARDSTKSRHDQRPGRRKANPGHHRDADGRHAVPEGSGEHRLQPGQRHDCDPLCPAAANLPHPPLPRKARAVSLRKPRGDHLRRPPRPPRRSPFRWYRSPRHRRRPQGSIRPPHVPRVPFLNFGQDFRRVAAHFQPAPLRADVGAGGDVQLHLGLGRSRCRCRDRPALRRPAAGEAALEVRQRLPGPRVAPPPGWRPVRPPGRGGRRGEILGAQPAGGRAGSPPSTPTAR